MKIKWVEFNHYKCIPEYFSMSLFSSYFSFFLRLLIVLPLPYLLVSPHYDRVSIAISRCYLYQPVLWKQEITIRTKISRVKRLRYCMDAHFSIALAKYTVIRRQQLSLDGQKDLKNLVANLIVFLKLKLRMINLNTFDIALCNEHVGIIYVLDVESC